MKKLVALLALMAIAVPAFAQGGLNLGNLDCFIDGAPPQSVTNTCTSNTGTVLQLNASAKAPVQLDRFVAIEGVIDVQVNDAVLPAWWQMGTGQCRSVALSISADFTSGPANCVDFWQGQAIAVGGIAGGSFGPNRFRILAAVATATENVLDADTEYGFFKANISRARTIGASPCAGCNVPACLVLNEIKLIQPAGVGDVRVTNPIGNNFVSYNGAIAQCPGATPAQNRTWGAVKALYR